ncbi:glucose dehydrogenase [Bradyrhizobium sp. i1.3.1]
MLVRGLTRLLAGIPAVLCACCCLMSPASAQSDLAGRMKDPGQWPMAARDYANTRYSELDQINASNASRLQLAWTFSVGVDRGQEAAPLVVDGTMYVVSPYAGPYPNRVFALDATTGELKWSYAPKPEPAAAGVACCDVVNRGLAFDNGKIFLNTLDDHTVAIDARTGKELWAHQARGDQQGRDHHDGARGGQG